MPLLLDKNDIAKKISELSSLVELEILRVQYLGKKGTLTSEMKLLSSFSIVDKAIWKSLILYLWVMNSSTDILFLDKYK